MTTNEETLKFLRHAPLFQRLPEKCYGDLAACVQPVKFETGQVIIQQGDLGEDFFVIKTGGAAVTVDGTRVADLGAEDYFGENALLQNQPRTATITTTKPTVAFKITRSRFQQYHLHEKLEVPKKDKLTQRHKMMARQAARMTAGTAQKKTPHGMSNSVANNNQQRSSTIPEQKDNSQAAAAREKGKLDTNNQWRQGLESSAQKRSLWNCEGQCTAMKEIFTHNLNITAFLFVPVGQYVAYKGYSPGLVFTANFLAIVPLASILGQATEALVHHTGQLIGGLLNATFGNAVEMIMCIQAVRAGLVSVVQGNLLGSILSNLLLVLGMSIVASGIARHEQKFNASGAAANMSCQLVASISVCLPTVFALIRNHNEDDVLLLSRICSFFLVSVYGMFLYFMLMSHHDLFTEEEDDEDDEGTLNAPLAVMLLFLCTLVVFFCSACLVDSIDEVSQTYGLSKNFIGVILLPIVGNAAEHATAVSAAYKGMMDLALGVAVGSSTQIALFVVPCAVMAGYFYDTPMNLNFTVFDSTCQLLTVFLVSQILEHGRTNWLHGVMLMTVYGFIALINLYSHN